MNYFIAFKHLLSSKNASLFNVQAVKRKGHSPYHVSGFVIFSYVLFLATPTPDGIIQTYLNLHIKKIILHKWLSPLSQQISAISFRFAKIAHSKMSEMSASLDSSFPLIGFCWDCSSVLYSGLKIKHSFNHNKYNVVWYIFLAWNFYIVSFIIQLVLSYINMKFLRLGGLHRME